MYVFATGSGFSRNSHLVRPGDDLLFSESNVMWTQPSNVTQQYCNST